MGIKVQKIGGGIRARSLSVLVNVIGGTDTDQHCRIFVNQFEDNPAIILHYNRP